MMCNCWRLRFSAALLVVLALPALAAAQTAEPLSRPDWSAIFSPDGKVVDLKGGIDAFFLEDKISEGMGIDMSVIVPADVPTVDNGVVTAANDLGNGYVYVKRDSAGNLQFYAGVERIASSADTYVEFELNQGVVGVTSGTPWPIHGERTAGDILVRVNFVGGALASATLERWDGAAFQRFAEVAADGSECNGVDYLVCAGTPPIDSVQGQVWDATFNLIRVSPPSAFVEVGLNLGTTEFTSIQVRTAEDAILDAFRAIGAWAQSTKEGGQQ